MKTCKVEGCGAKSYCRHYCGRHYQKWKKWGNPLHVQRFDDGGALSSCRIKGCNNRAIAKFLCNTHRLRIKRYGSPYFTKKAANGSGCISKDGYKLFTRNAKQTPEHRLILERKLGRKLAPNEITHHINGDKLDNRPENLQVTSRSEHPKIHYKLRHLI